MSEDVVVASVRGFEDLAERLQGLSSRMQAGTLRRAINAASAILTPLVSANAPRDTWTLSANIGPKKLKTKRGRVRTLIGARNVRRVVVRGGQDYVVNPARYAHLVEFGTKRTKANPFMRRAWDMGKAAAMSAANAEIVRGLARDAKRRKTVA